MVALHLSNSVGGYAKSGMVLGRQHSNVSVMGFTASLGESSRMHSL